MKENRKPRFLVFVVLLLVSAFMGCNHVPNNDKCFSVSADRQVVFAPGNLAEGGKEFVARQWYCGWLFGWGTGDRPMDTVDDMQAYVHFVDWGDYVEGDWRTLTCDEWHYLLFERKDANEKRAIGTVNGMNGLLLLPDEWSLPSGCSFDCQATDWDVNSYSVEEWIPMEIEGAVFLPANGFRWGEMPFAFNCEGLYWSSTTKMKGCPYTMHFDDNILAIDWEDDPQFGQSVRLVRDCK